MQKQIRNTKGQYAHNQIKDTVAVLIVCFVVTATAYAGHAISKHTPLIHPAQAEETATTTSRYCLTAGHGTGSMTSYCADSPEHLIETIQHNWDEEPVEKPDEAPKQPIKSKYKRKASNPQIEALIRAKAQKQGYEDVEFAINLADCESLLNPKASNTYGNTPAGSKDRGLYMFNSYWQARVSDTCAYSAECATEEAIKMLKTGKAHLWACTKIVK